MSIVSKSTRSDDHPPDRHPIPAHTRNTVEKGMVLPGYGNPIPVPIPVHTHDRIITVLPIPVSLLNLPQGTTNQHPPHVHEQLLVGWIAGGSSDDGDEGDDECNLAPSTTTEMTRPWHQTPLLQPTACRE
jgi:hypothetical protein